MSNADKIIRTVFSAYAYRQGVRAALDKVTPVCPYDTNYESSLRADWLNGLSDGRKMLNIKN